MCEISSPVEGCFIWAIVEYLEELWAPQVIHKLRIKSEVLWQAEAVWIIFCILTKLLTLCKTKLICEFQYTYYILHCWNYVTQTQVSSTFYLQVWWACDPPIATHLAHHLSLLYTQPSWPLRQLQLLGQIQHLCDASWLKHLPNLKTQKHTTYWIAQTRNNSPLKREVNYKNTISP